MSNKYKLKPYFSERTKNLISERNQLFETFYGRTNKSKKARALAFKDIQITFSKSKDLVYSSIKNPLTLCFLISTFSFGTYILSSMVIESQFDHKFFKSIESDPTIPKSVMLRVQDHYYKNK